MAEQPSMRLKGHEATPGGLIDFPEGNQLGKIRTVNHAYQPQAAPRSIVSAVLTAISALALLGACSETTSDIPLAILVAQQGEYSGQTLTTSGIVRTFAEPRHYWIEDGNLNRVAIEPNEAVSGLVGERVRVTGLYQANYETGRVLRAAEVTVLESEPS